MNHPSPRPTARIAATLTLMLLSVSLAAPATAGSLPEDLQDAIGDDSADPNCPDQHLDKLILCIVDDTINNNTIIRALLRHAGYHYENISNARNYTVDQTVNLTLETLDYEWDVEWATWLYADATRRNAEQLAEDGERAAGNAQAYGVRVADGECTFYLGFACTGGDPRFDDVGSGLGAPPPSSGCPPGVIQLIRCHYTTVAFEARNQSTNTTNEVSWAAYWFEDRQDNATRQYRATVESETRAYAAFVVGWSAEAVTYYRGFASRECKLVYSGCPIDGMVTVDPRTLLPLLG